MIVDRLAFIFSFIALASPALADAGLTLALPLGADAEIKTVQYTCQSHDPVTMQYINAAPNYLAILPLDGQQLVFASALAASGTKYVSGQYELFSKGPDITLQDVTEGLDAAPVLQCAEDNLAP
jgi:membrane-bound inhibitor of C-type lysozyme